jgi:hypothetical protein
LTEAADAPLGPYRLQGAATPSVVPSIADIERKAAQAAFARPLITNVHRGLLAEAIVASALEPDWRWCSEDYSSWDFENHEGIRLEVKQSAARQTWTPVNGKPSACSFDIAMRTGRWENGIEWIEAPGRSAHLYVFAHHPVFDDTADHRNPEQWLFYVVATASLPNTKRVGLTTLRSMMESCSYAELRGRVEKLSAF